MKLKVAWIEFVELAMEKLREKHPTAVSPKFMLSRGYEPDYENYSNPDYVEVELPNPQP